MAWHTQTLGGSSFGYAVVRPRTLELEGKYSALEVRSGRLSR